MKVTITNDAIKETKSIAERQKIRKPVLYLDLAQSCCSSIPKVDVVDQTSSKLEIVGNVNGIPICASDRIKNFLKENEEQNDLELKVDLIIPLGLSFQLLKDSKIEDAQWWF
jgi:uncharacterized protein YqkB